MNTISVTVRDRQGTSFSGEAVSLTAFNKNGRFDVLYNHSNFISIILRKLQLTRSDGVKQEFNFTTGVIQVIKNKVMVYLGVK